MAADAQVASSIDAATPDAAEPDAMPVVFDAAPDAPPPISIPDPSVGTGDNWFADTNPHSTPETAWPVGVATFDADYIEGMGDASGAFFYVFQAGPTMTSFSLSNVFEFTGFHLHEGSGLVFGAEITPTTSAADSATWPVTANSIYVLEMAGGPTGFF